MFTDDIFDPGGLRLPDSVARRDSWFRSYRGISLPLRQCGAGEIRRDRHGRKARGFTNVEVYFPKKYMEEQDEITSWNFFVGFKVHDVHHGDLGEVVDVDDATMNVLFVIEKEGEELLLPAHEEFILDIDKVQKVLTVDIPEGLLD